MGIKFKTEDVEKSYQEIDERLKEACEWCATWSSGKGVNFVITRAIDGMIQGVSRTNIHAEKRAVDVSISGWDADLIDEFIHDSNKMFSDSIGAYSVSDGKPRFCVFHVGTAPHFHLQCRR